MVIIFTSWTLACLSMAENIDGVVLSTIDDIAYVSLSTWHCHVINVL